MSEHADDASLVLSVQQGEPEAFGELFRRHWPDVRRLCARRTGSVVDGDEIAQAAFVKAYERIDQCGGDRRFGAWVTVIAARLCADAGRRSGRLVLGDVPEETTSRAGDPEEAVLRLEGARAVGSALGKLPPRQREVIVARDIEGRRPAEIAAALGLSIGAVDSLLLRARRRLASALGSGAEVGATTAPMASALTGAVASSATAAGFVGDVLRRFSVQVAQVLGLGPGVPGRTMEGLAAAGVAVAVALAGTGGPPPADPAQRDVQAEVIALVPPAVGDAAVPVAEPAAAAPSVEVPSAPSLSTPAAPVESPAPPETSSGAPEVADVVVAPLLEELVSGLSTAVDKLQIPPVAVGH